MALLEALTDKLSNSIAQLAPITLSVPTSPIFQVSRFLHHVTTTPVHPVYVPYLRFGVIHAARVTTVWAGLTKGRKNGKKVGLLQDLFGYLTMAWGGSTVVSLLLNQPPTWLSSPTPWIIYPSVYLLLIPTGLSNYIISTCPTTLFNIFGALVDGMTRATTITSLVTLIGSSSPFINAANGDVNLWTYALLSALAITSGGLFVGLFGLGEDEWKMGVPGLLKGGLLGTLDAWGASLIGLLWLALTRQSSSLAPFSEFLHIALPSDIHSTAALGTKPASTEPQPIHTQHTTVIDTAHARAICAILLGGLLATRAIILSLRSGRSQRSIAASGPQLSKKTELFVVDEKGVRESVLKSPVSAKATRTENAKVTPRKSPRAKGK
ncbi:hypothetical protein I317_04493 [Kwoniella heveanensis CBS 569]|nr:hypothetical protein I317_04493 [Kwoniella heveanensis CBS 569]